MLGTLNGALEARGLKLDSDAISADAKGINEILDRLPVLTRIEICYRLQIPAGTREIVDRALERHASRCPTAATLHGAVELSWSADIEEIPE